jgi:histidine kinase/two-component system sensor kinase Ihk
MGSLSLITGILIISFLLISLLTPRFYRMYKEEMLNTDFNVLMPLLDNMELSVITAQLERFAAIHDYSITLRDEQGSTVFSRALGISVSFTQPNFLNNGDFTKNETVTAGERVMDETIDERFTESNRVFTTELITGSRTLYDNTGHVFTLNLSSSVQPIDEARTILYRVFPYALLISLTLSAVVSYIYTKTITAPVKAISKAAIKMRTLEKDARCDIKSKDEIGELAVNINELYGRLLTTINDLQNEIQNTAAQDKAKIDFMLTVSHEIKTPLTSVKGMIEGMIHNVGVYKNRDEYLTRCGENIDALALLVNEILDASKFEITPSAEDYADTRIERLVRDITATHKMIALSKQVTINITIDANINKTIAVRLFSKALSNVISNAVKYSDTGGTVKIYADNERLVVENNCVPLSTEELRRVFEPLYGTGISGHPANERKETGHGLGLYLTERILKVCGLPFEFIPFENGMRFIIYFSKTY